MATPETLVVVSHYDRRPAEDLVALLDQLGMVPAGLPFATRVVVSCAASGATAVLRST